MSKYKIVKDNDYDNIHTVSKWSLNCWKRVGNICIDSDNEADIIAKAKELLTEPIYFEA